MSNRKIIKIAQIAVLDVVICCPFFSTLAQFSIEDLANIGTASRAESVLNELEAMQHGEDPRSPRSQSSKKLSTRKKPVRISGTDENKKKEGFAAKVARCFKAVTRKFASAISLEPQPGQFKSKKEYVDAYVSYKVENSDEEIQDKYAKKLGGMNTYRFEMKREAESNWKLAQRNKR